MQRISGKSLAPWHAVHLMTFNSAELERLEILFNTKCRFKMAI
jgi:hypothetical protein